MKRLTNAILPIRLTGLDNDDVLEIKFKFTQYAKSKIAVYPSSDVEYFGEGVYGVHWTPSENGEFSNQSPVTCDAQIWLKGSSQNLDVMPTTFMLTESTFTYEEATNR